MDTKEILLTYLRNEMLDRTLGENREGRTFYERYQLERAENLDESTKIIEDGIIDSLSLVALRDFIESQFKIDIPDELATVQTLGTVNDIIALVDSLKSNGRPS